jgi:5'-nucleotidase/UDP-sugar diphosphatase
MTRANKWWGAAVLATGGWLVGCQDAATTGPAAAGNGVRSDVVDVRPMDPVAGPTAVPAAYQPAVYDTTGSAPTVSQPMTPVVSETPGASATKFAPASAGEVTAAAGSKHTVRKGETFYSIARAAYGNGKLWKKLAAANPTVASSSLKVGQVLIVP